MGERSQIYIRITDNYNKKPKLYAKYFGWNFRERMISRARYGIEYINRQNPDHYSIDSVQEKINKIFDVNFDMKDVAISSDILKEYIEEEWYKDYGINEFIFNMQDNNDGKLFIDINENDKVKYCFTDYNLKIFSPIQYMNWNKEDWRKHSEYFSTEDIETCKKNIEYIKKNAQLMTKEELQEFITFDYSEQINNLKSLLQQNEKDREICDD